MQIETDGLVIMERQVGESDRLITVLTREEGVLLRGRPSCCAAASSPLPSCSAIPASSFIRGGINT